MCKKITIFEVTSCPKFDVPRIMKYIKLSLLALVLLSFTTSCSKDEPIETVEEVNLSIDLNLANETDWEMSNEILNLVNDYRLSIDLPTLKLDQQYASAYAVDHTYHMIDMSNINHDNFAVRSKGMKERGAKIVGENVAYGYKTAEAVVQAWLNSPGHKKIIEGAYTHSGFGVMPDNKGNFYFTQLFYKK